MATFDINEYINGIYFTAEPAFPFGELESTSNDQYKNLMTNYLDDNVSQGSERGSITNHESSKKFQEGPSWGSALGNWLEQNELQGKLNKLLSLKNNLEEV